MVCSRGFDYVSKGTAESQRHANCKCTPVVEFDVENPKLEGYDPDALYDEYDNAYKTVMKTDPWKRWKALSKKEQSWYGDAHHGAYDHFKRNLIIAEMNRAARAKKAEAKRVSKAEYAEVTSAINTVYNARFKGEAKGFFYYGNCGYQFNINEFNDYEIIKKWEIE